MDSSEPHLGKVLLWLFYNTNQQRDVSRASLWNWMFLIPLNTRLYKPKTKSLVKPYKPKTQYLYNDKEDNTGLKPNYPISQPIGWKIIFILHYQILLWKCLHNQISINQSILVKFSIYIQMWISVYIICFYYKDLQ